MDAWIAVLLALGGNAAALAVLGWLGKSLLDSALKRQGQSFESDLRHKSDAAIERLKSDLHATSETAIEGLRSELQRGTIEHQVRFSRLHEQRAQVIAELYEHLVKTLWEAESFLSPITWQGEPDKAEKHRRAMNMLAEFYQLFDVKRIYLPAPLCESLQKLFMSVREHVINFGSYINIPELALQEHTRKEKDEVWTAGWKAIRDEVPKARARLEHEFRILLGAEPST